jgi:hypothetical protein
MSDQRTNRRVFLKHSAGAVAATIGVSYWSQRSAADSRLPSEKLNIAFIGTDGQAVYHLDALASMGHNCPCFCDVDTRRLARAAAAWPKAARHQAASRVAFGRRSSRPLHRHRGSASPTSRKGPLHAKRPDPYQRQLLDVW